MYTCNFFAAAFASVMLTASAVYADSPCAPTVRTDVQTGATFSTFVLDGETIEIGTSLPVSYGSVHTSCGVWMLTGLTTTSGPMAAMPSS